MDRREAAYWSSLGASPRWVEERLAQSRVTVEGAGGGLVRHLEANGARVGTGEPTLAIVVCGDYLEAHLAEVNRRQLEAGAPWAPVRPNGVEPLFGPVFPADRKGPCRDCLAYRLRSHREVHGFLRNVAGEEAAFRPFAAQPAVLETMYGLIAAEIVKWLVLGESAPIHEHAIAMDLATFASSQHRVVRRPQCLACGDEALHRPDRPPAPVSLKASPKAHRTSGGARAVAPEATLAKYRHLVSPISGVVTWLSRTTDEADSWLHVYWAGSNPGMRSRSLSSLRRSLRSKSAGKGSTRQQSKVSALCEAVERYSGARHGDEIRIRKRFVEFAGKKEAIHPNEVQLFSESQLDDAASINAKGHPYNIVPPRL
ncbi:MAG: TOMM precursor leader peptide-binding protein, partial [Gammaproteobacteria bacterium]|nr:TOMM precursor leader peptide-binding protein [Gammaproteobacteria bacterium]